MRASFERPRGSACRPARRWADSDRRGRVALTRFAGASAALGLTLMLVAGCQVPRSARPPVVRDDIVAVRQYYAAEPWIRDDEGRVIGICARVYFLAAAGENQQPKGVFVPGTIHAALHVLTPRPDGTSARELAYEWTFPPEQAQGFRILRPSKMGDSYGLFLRWPPELDLMGREVQITFSYRRQDGELVSRRGSRFRVPVPAGGVVPRESRRHGPAESAPAATRPAAAGPAERGPTSGPTPPRGVRGRL